LLHKAIPHIGDFPYRSQPESDSTPASTPSPTPADSGYTVWEGPTLFLKGEHSRYLNKYNIPVAKRFFPNMRLETLDTGHWVHAERPAETVGLIDEFVKGVKA
jgi:pimeloyl-ACP methyl ester carboxylesterase